MSGRTMRLAQFALGAVAVAGGAAVLRKSGRPGKMATATLTVNVPREAAFNFFVSTACADIDAMLDGHNAVTVERANELIALTSGGKHPAAMIYFIDVAPRGTEIHVSAHGAGGDALREALRKSKAHLETGEIPTGERR